MRGDQEITNSEKVIDSRDIIARIAYLQDERQTLADALQEKQEALQLYVQNTKIKDENSETRAELLEDVSDAHTSITEWDESEERRELKILEALQDECQYGDWKYGAQLIQDAYFEEYARELASECGDIKDTDRWPFTCIDWERAADDLKQDYNEVDFDGTSYWIRD